MGSTSTAPEALAGLRAALETWASTARGISLQASSAAENLVAEAEKAVRTISAQRDALEALLQTAKKEDRARLGQELNATNTALERARRALDVNSNGARKAQLARRRIEESIAERVPRADQSLVRKLDALSRYKAVSTPRSNATPLGTGGSPGGSDFGVPGIVDVPLERADFNDNPIREGVHKGGAETADYRWALETWQTVVRPGVLAGRTREDFQRRDIERGQETGFRRTTGVYDMFLGSDPVHFSRRADGTLDVSSGRHRVAIARQLGITHLPGKLYE